MAFTSYSTVLLGKACAVLFIGQLLSSATFGQITNNAVQTLDSNLHDNSYKWYVALATVAGSISILFVVWQQKNKLKVENPNLPFAADNKIANANVAQKSNSQAVTAATSKQKTGGEKASAEPPSKRDKAHERHAAWVGSRLNINAGATALAVVGASVPKAVLVTANNKISPVIPRFETPKPVDLLVPLPSSDDEVLIKAIQQAIDFDASEEERELSLLTLADFMTENSVETLSQIALYDGSPRLRISAVSILADFNHESVFEPVLMACADIAREVRAAAARALSKLDFDRANAFTRIIESKDVERQRLAAMACIDAGLVNHAFARLIYKDRKQANEAFAIMRLLVTANKLQPIIGAIQTHADLQVRLATIQLLKMLESDRVLPALRQITADEKLPAVVRQALDELIDYLSKT